MLTSGVGGRCCAAFAEHELYWKLNSSSSSSRPLLLPKQEFCHPCLPNGSGSHAINTRVHACLWAGVLGDLNNVDPCTSLRLLGGSGGGDGGGLFL